MISEEIHVGANGFRANGLHGGFREIGRRLRGSGGQSESQRESSTHQMFEKLQHEGHPFEFRLKFTARQPMQSLDGSQMGVVSNDPQAITGNRREGIRRRRAARGGW